MIYIISSLHPMSDSRIYNRQVLSLSKQYSVKYFAQGVEGWHPENISYVALPAGRKLRVRLGNCWRLLRASLAKEARVIHFHDPELIPVGLIAKLFGKKVVYDVHENYVLTIRHKRSIPKLLRGVVRVLFKLFENLSCRRFDLVLVVTDDLGKCLPGNVHTIPNYPLISFTPPERQPSQGALKLVYAGLISPARGILNMIEAVKKVKVPVTFDIIGHYNSPEFQDSVNAKIQGIENINYLQSIPYTSYFKHLVQYDVGMMCLLPYPNHLTSTPNKLFEYMAMGMAILASDFPFWQGFLGKHACGVWVDPLDTDAIAAAIERLECNREETAAMGRQGQEVYQALYNWESQEKKLLTLYNKMLGEKNA
jgi:glycosyltransferase involved in cell wall biosynthesis